MSGYSSVSIISIFCYAFLLLTFAFSKEKVKVLRTFMMLLFIMILWTGGSIGMRLQFWPSANIWHHVSLLGMMLLPFGYYQFVQDFLDEKRGILNYVLSLSFIALFLFNVLTNYFIPLPEVVKVGGQTQFLYHYTWRVYLFFGIVGLETAFPALYTYLVQTGLVPLETIIRALTVKPRNRFGIEAGDSFTVWRLDESFTVDPNEFLTLGRATPYTGETLCGRCVLTVCDEKVVYQCD